MAELRALIFDVDGTIAQTERDAHRVAFNLAFREAGLTWDWSESLYGDLLEVAGGKERIRHYLEQYQPKIAPDFDPDSLIPQLHHSKTRHYQQLLSQNPLNLRPGVARLIAEARTQGVKIAIATTAALPNVLALLENSLSPDSPDWFEIIAAGDIVPKKKPAPDIYLYVLEKLNLAPENCLVIEDSPQGLQSASQADLTTLITVNDYTKELDFSQAKLILNHLGEPESPLEILGGNLASQFRALTYVNLDFAQQLLSLANPF